MAAATTCMGTLTKLSMAGFRTQKQRNMSLVVSAQSQDTQEVTTDDEEIKAGQETVRQKPEPGNFTPLRPAESQINVKSKNMAREYGGQWLSSTTRHVRIFAAYIDPVTCAFDQTQMDKLTLILDPTNEFDWTPESCNLVYSYFQDLVDHYEGAPLTEYTLRLIGSDIEHYIRKLLFDGEIKYNMDARVLNFSMGKPRVGFGYNDNDVNQY